MKVAANNALTLAIESQARSARAIQDAQKRATTAALAADVERERRMKAEAHAEAAQQELAALKLQLLANNSKELSAPPILLGPTSNASEALIPEQKINAPSPRMMMPETTAQGLAVHPEDPAEDQHHSLFALFRQTGPDGKELSGATMAADNDGVFLEHAASLGMEWTGQENEKPLLPPPPPPACGEAALSGECVSGSSMVMESQGSEARAANRRRLQRASRAVGP